MESLRDLALAYYQNLPHERKTDLLHQFNEAVDDGTDFSEGFRNYSVPMPRFPEGWLETCELFQKKTMDFEEFVTGIYVCMNARIVLLCRGCSSLITGKPYFICVDCFDDLSGGRSFNLCCGCYRSKNFNGHQHRRFSSNHSMLRRCRVDASLRESEEERRYWSIDNAMLKFCTEFMEFVRSVTTDEEWENRFGSTLNIENDNKLEKASPSPLKELEREKSEEEENSTMSTPHRSRNRYVDLLGAVPTENAGVRIRNN